MNNWLKKQTGVQGSLSAATQLKQKEQIPAAGRIPRLFNQCITQETPKLHTAVLLVGIKCFMHDHS